MPVVLPGDILSLPSTSSSASIRLGPGLVYPSEAARTAAPTQLLVTRGGVVGKVDEKGKGKEKRGEGWWVEGPVGRYVPSPGDAIIGQITAKNAEFYTLSLNGSAHSATLPVLAFEGATKRHRPNLKIGALVYGLVTSAESWMEPEVTCVDPSTGKGNGMGELEGKEGTCGVVEISLGFAKSLLRPSHPLLQTLSTHFPLESAIGTNGLIWLRLSHPSHYLASKLVLEAADRFGRNGIDELAVHSEPGEEEWYLKEKRPGDWGKKLAAGWGRLDPKEVGRIVRSVLAS